MLYRVSLKYGTFYATFELRAIGQTNLEIESAKTLPTIFEHDKGSMINSWPPLFLMEAYTLWRIIELVKAKQTF